MRISQRTAYIISGGLVLFAVLPSSWYVSFLHVFWPPGSSGASRADSEGDLWRQLIYQGAADLKLDQYEEAESHFRDALELADRFYSKTHHRRLQSLRLLSMALLDQDKSSEAVTVLDEEVDIKAATLPEDDVSLLESMGILASTLYDAGDAVRAASTAQRIIGIAEAHGNPVCEPVTHALMTLSKCDLDSGNIMAAGEAKKRRRKGRRKRRKGVRMNMPYAWHRKRWTRQGRGHLRAVHDLPSPIATPVARDAGL